MDGVAVRGLFSADLHALTAREEHPEPRTLQAMEDVRVLLLRGESGAGKTVAMAQEVERLRSAGKPVEMADLNDALCDVASLLEKKGHQPDLTIFLDGLDVGMIRDFNLDPTLRRAAALLASGPGARLRLAIRSGFSAEHLARYLSTHFADDFEHLTIAPLRPEDVRMAAAAEGIDPDAFFAALEGLRVAPLSARPPTLRMLLRLWKAQNGRLPTRRQDIYRLGCEVLLREANPTRLTAGGGHAPDYAGHLETPERFAVAARLAALMTFGDHDRLDLGAESDEAGLHIDAVTGGVEPVPGGNTKVTRGAVREIVGTALFRSAGTDQFAFSHPSFMRYMAAAFVKARCLSPSQGLPLLSAPDGRIGANRIEAASWLGALDPEFFEHLSNADPQVLLRAGIPAATSEQRLLLANSLLEHSAIGSLDLEELSATGDLVLLSSRGLDKLLSGVLGNKAEPLARRKFAALVAQDTGCTPVSACEAVALDGEEPLELRLAALTALRNSAKEAQSTILALIDAPDEDIRIAALAIAMRSLLSPADVIQRLKPTTFHSAQTYLCLHLLDSITPETLPDALNAILTEASREKTERGHHDHLMVVQSLVERAFAQLGDLRVRNALAKFIADIPPYEPWLRWSFPLNKRGMPPAATLDYRRALVSAVVTLAPNSAAAARNLLEACFLIRHNDLGWIVEEARSALRGPGSAVWSTLAQEVALGCGSPPYTHLRREGLSFAEINQFAQASLPLPPDYQRWTPPRSWDPLTERFSHEGEVRPQPEEPILKVLDDWQLLTIQTKGGGRANAVRVPPITLLELADQADRRLVRDSSELLRVVHESLERLQKRLKGRDPLVRALWDEGKASRPKDENFFSDFIVDHLRCDLVGRGVVADREVQIRPRLRDTAGERTDIQVQAFTRPGAEGRRQEVASLTIEVKGCWNRELHTAMKSQLLERYLISTRDTVGLYLVGWYVCPAWGRRKIAGKRPTPESTMGVLQKMLEDQARSLSNPAHHIEIAVIDATLS